MNLFLISINQQGISDFVSSFNPAKIKHWLTVSPFDIQQLNKQEQINFLLLLNALSFCYWGEPKWTIQYQGKVYDGAQAMLAALGRAYQEGLPILNSNYWNTMNKKTLQYILRGNIEIPLIDERLQHINELGTTHFKINKQDALELVNKIIKLFPSFNDPGFNKRAQLLVNDLAHFNLIQVKNLDKLTACADYKLPQVLRRYNILEYSPSLIKKIKTKQIISQGSIEEISIRRQTILAVEKIKKELEKKYPTITSLQINDYLWLEGQKKLINDEPYHRTLTTFY